MMRLSQNHPIYVRTVYQARPWSLDISQAQKLGEGSQGPKARQSVATPVRVWFVLQMKHGGPKDRHKTCVAVPGLCFARTGYQGHPAPVAQTNFLRRLSK
jgi:hypothetical protein